MKTETLRRGLAELAVVIIGILAALAFDAWWTERQQRALETTYLAVVHTEFAAVEGELTDLATSSRGNSQSMAQIDSLLEGTSPAVSREAFHELTLRLWFFQPFVPSMPGYEEFKATLGLGEVSDPLLRRALFEFESDLATALYYDEFLVSQVVASWEPLLARLLPGRGASAGHAAMLPSTSVLATNLEFRNLLAERGSFELDLAEVREELAMSVRSVTDEIDRVLGR